MIINKSIVNSILKLNVSKANFNRYLKNHYKRIYNQIVFQTKFLEKFKNEKNQISIFERLYCIENNLEDRPLCQTCNKEHVCGFNTGTHEYRKWCSPSCQASDEKCVEKSKKTRLEKYGNENYVAVEKSRKTRMKHNNGKWHNDDFGNKCKQTNIKNGHDANWHNNEKQKETVQRKVEENPDYWNEREQKTKATKIRNGKDPNWNNREKYHQTCTDRYNVESYPMSQDYKDKTKATIASIPDFYEKRNEQTKMTISQIPDFYEKRNEKTKETNLKRIGVEYYFQTDDCKELRYEKQIQLNYQTLLQSEYDAPVFNEIELFIFADDHSHEFEFECKKCKNHFFSSLYGTNHSKCKQCFPIPKSKYEEEIYSFCKSFYKKEIVHRKNARKIIYPYELDLYFPADKLAIEFDGLYWHSEAENKDDNYHVMKTNMCQDKGIQLIHIFENEWINDKEIVKDYIRKLLNCSEKTIQADKCKVEYVHDDVAKKFQQENDIKKSINSKINVGLFYKDELVALMSFGKPQYTSDKYQYQLLRSCTKKGYIIKNASNILLKRFESDYQLKEIVAYADRRWSNGKEYESIGFQLDHISKPNHWYFLYNSLELEHSSKYKKKDLSKLLDKYDENKTIVENMSMNGFRRIFDCGNLVYIKTYQ